MDRETQVSVRQARNELSLTFVWDFMTWVPWTLGLQSRETGILIGCSRRHVTQPETAANTVGTTAADGVTGTQ